MKAAADSINEPEPACKDQVVPNQIRVKIKPPPVPKLKDIALEVLDTEVKSKSKRQGSLLGSGSWRRNTFLKAASVALGGSVKIVSGRNALLDLEKESETDTFDERKSIISTRKSMTG